MKTIGLKYVKALVGFFLKKSHIYTIASSSISSFGNLFHKICTDIFCALLELDAFCNRDTVFRHLWAFATSLDYDSTTL